jgi:hypothetical protein
VEGATTGGNFASRRYRICGRYAAVIEGKDGGQGKECQNSDSENDMMNFCHDEIPFCKIMDLDVPTKHPV